MEFELVRELKPSRSGQTVELYKFKDGRYFVLSTVTELRTGDPILDSYLDMGALASEMLGDDLPSTGEETMAFWSDEEGENHDAPIRGMRVNGPESRALCLKKLKEPTQGEW